MIQNYFKTAWRNLLKNKSFTFINLLGLATGFAITLLIIQYVRYEFSYENNHENADKLVRLTVDYLDGETVTAQDCETNPPLGAKIKKEMKEVANFTRAYPVGEPSVTIEIGNQQHILNRLLAVDRSFFDMFTNPILFGSINSFDQPNQAVVTESTALKYFNRKDVVGEHLSIVFSQGSVLLNIAAVVPDSPSNTHLKFDMLISYPTMIKDKAMLDEYNESEDNWGGNNTFTYISLNDQTSFNEFEASLTTFNTNLQKEFNSKEARFLAQKITDIHLYSNKPFEPEPNGDAKSVYFLLGVAFLVIISAFVNYINLATSKALDRAKEVGIRKVVGSTKTQLRMQFLIESFVVNLMAGLFALILVIFTTNKFIEISNLPLGFTVFNDLFFWLTLLSFVLLGVFFSGLYPAFVLSSFKPSSVLKGSFSHSTQGAFLRKGLVVFQFAITVVLLIVTFTVNEQIDFMRNKDLGVNIEKTIVVNAPTSDNARSNYSVFKQTLLSNSEIQSVALSGAVPGQLASQMSTTTGINISKENNYNFYITTIDNDFIPLMGMELIGGENFKASSKTEQNDVIVNEEALRLWGIRDVNGVIGEKLKFWGNEWTIIGVLKNYHQETAKSPHIPIIHRFTNDFDGFASIKFNNDRPKQQLSEIKKVYASVFPGSPFTYFFMDKAYHNQFKADERFQKVFSILTAFSILIACLGLFGLASFTVSKRKKEIGVRKVLGASSMRIVVLLTNNFIKTVFISVIISVPVTYFIVSRWLENFAFRIELNWWLFLIPILLVFVLVILSVSIKTIYSAMANPVESLRSE